jgi:hypothetical protein
MNFGFPIGIIKLLKLLNLLKKCFQKMVVG